MCIRDRFKLTRSQAREPSVLQLDGSVVAYNFKPTLQWMAEEEGEGANGENTSGRASPTTSGPPALPASAGLAAHPLTLKFAGWFAQAAADVCRDPEWAV
eukprot:TRINITY_DN7506_c0_g1_i3.p1 TRINITY_DN7506_c0_g1~~TRINITY_DN7506_c0_g1_i3.p1  ORF type:complete len:100 (-),score=29.98 TRINITY_DN7506_c0_g1_i3:324-623(-)